MTCENCGQRYDASVSGSGSGYRQRVCLRCNLRGLAGRLSNDRRDFFISFCSPHRKEAERIYKALLAHGKRAYFFGETGGSEDITPEVQAAIDHSDRIICVVSPGYFESARCRSEVNSFENHSRKSDRIVLFQVADCRIPRTYKPVRLNDLVAVDPQDYDNRVGVVINNLDKQYTEYGVEDRSPDERLHVWNRHANSAAPRPVYRRYLGWAASIVALYDASYFPLGPSGEWDPREALTYATTSIDISLPWNWIQRSANLSEYIAEVTPEGATHWEPLEGASMPWIATDRGISVDGASLLKSTAFVDGIVEDGIAQFRTVHRRGPIKLLADVRGHGAAYRGFRIDHDSTGGLVPSFFEKQPGGRESILKRYAAVRVAPSVSMHDLGISKDGEVYSLYRNRQVVATWKPEGGRELSWQGGAFGLGAEGGATRLVRWSMTAQWRPSATARRSSAMPALFAFWAPRTEMRLR